MSTNEKLSYAAGVYSETHHVDYLEAWQLLHKRMVKFLTRLVL